MSTRKRILTAASLLTIAIVSVAYVAAQTASPPTTRPASQPADGPKLSDVAWITGAWYGEALGGKVEEHWIAPAGGCMIGMFRLVGEDKMQVCEFMMIEQQADGVVYRFRHYGPGLRPWEPDDKPLTFHLVRATDSELVFEHPKEQTPKRLIYRRDGEKGLVVRVETEKDGKITRAFDVKMQRP